MFDIGGKATSVTPSKVVSHARILVAVSFEIVQMTQAAQK